MSYTPWVEKYRPSHFNDIVLDDINKKILRSVIENDHFPNFLFYGPPGTGKTTTIINLVKMYQERYNQSNMGLMIHLNASDERGIDIIRNQINMFVTSKTLYGEGMKFVILDEVDYMTKNAQNALRYLLNSYNSIINFRFCLICNYISRIDDSLQTEFVRIRFNQLPKTDIIHFLQKINMAENLNLNKETLISIQRHFNSDIRSMINYMQSNQHLSNIPNQCKVITEQIWHDLTLVIKNNKKHVAAMKHINDICMNYNIEKKNILKVYLNYIIRNRINVSREFLTFSEHVMHLHQDCNMDIVLTYSVLRLQKFLQ